MPRCEVLYELIDIIVRTNLLCKPLKHGTSPPVQQTKRMCGKVLFCTSYIPTMRSVKGDVMHRKTKTKPLIVAFMLLSLGWAQPGWSVDLNADMRKLTNELAQKFASIRTGPYGAFVYKNISTIGIIYGLVALPFLLTPEYRDRGWHNLLIGCIAPIVFVALFVVGYAIAQTCREVTQAHSGMLLYQREFGWFFITLFTGIIGPLLMIVLGLSVWIGRRYLAGRQR
jgi:hypothetical protein